MAELTGEQLGRLPSSERILKGAKTVGLGHLGSLGKKAEEAVKTHLGRMALSVAALSVIISSGCGNTDKPNPELTPEPTSTSATFVPTETSTPIVEVPTSPPTLETLEETETEGLVLDGNTYIEIPMKKEGLFPQGDMTIELMAKLKSSKHPFETVGGPLLLAHRGDRTVGAKEYNLSYKRIPTNPFLSLEEIGRLKAKYGSMSPSPAGFDYEEAATLIWGGESSLQPGSQSTQSWVINEELQKASEVDINPEWQHIVLQREGGKLKMFINGKLVKTRESSGQGELLFDKGDSLTVGGYTSQDGIVNGFTGKIKGFILSDIARYQGNFDPKPPVVDEHTKVLMPLDGDTNDYSGNGNNGIIVGVGTGASIKP